MKINNMETIKFKAEEDIVSVLITYRKMLRKDFKDIKVFRRFERKLRDIIFGRHICLIDILIEEIMLIRHVCEEENYLSKDYFYLKYLYFLLNSIIYTLNDLRTIIMMRMGFRKFELKSEY